jgi:sec-independent protein translocase protein TatA
MTGWTSPTHIILLLLIALLLFGAKRLPEIGRSLGSGMREFKDSVTGHESEEPQQTPPQQIAPVQSVETTATPPVPVESAAAASSSEHERETV